MNFEFSRYFGFVELFRLTCLRVSGIFKNLCRASRNLGVPKLKTLTFQCFAGCSSRSWMYWTERGRYRSIFYLLISCEEPAAMAERLRTSCRNVLYHLCTRLIGEASGCHESSVHDWIFSPSKYSKYPNRYGATWWTWHERSYRSSMLSITWAAFLGPVDPWGEGGSNLTIPIPSIFWQIWFMEFEHF